MERSTTGDRPDRDMDPASEPGLSDPADKTQPAEGGVEEAIDGGTEPDSEDGGPIRPTTNDG